MKKFLFAIALVAFVGSTPAVSYALSNDISIIKNDDDKKKKAAAEKAAKKAALAEARAEARAEAKAKAKLEAEAKKEKSCGTGEKKSGCCSQKAAQ